MVTMDIKLKNIFTNITAGSVNVSVPTQTGSIILGVDLLTLYKSKARLLIKSEQAALQSIAKYQVWLSTGIITIGHT